MNRIFRPLYNSSPCLFKKILGAKYLLMAVLVIAVSGCTSLGSYDTKSEETLQSLRLGDAVGALNGMGQHDPSDEKASEKILPFMEKGSVEVMVGDFDGALVSWTTADQGVQKWEEQAKINPSKVAEAIGSVLINDKVRKYDPANYEKVFLTSNIGLLHAAMDNWDKARTEIKKTHEREAVIAEVNAKKYAKAEEDAAKSDQSVKSYKELDGYPVEIFESPKILGLKNSYQNTLSHYLSGFVYEALGESSLAAPGYRKAIELNPNAPILQTALESLDRRSSEKSALPRKSDVLFVISAGEIARKLSQSIPVPIFTKDGLVVAPISFPIFQESPHHFFDVLSVDGETVVTQQIMDVDAMAMRELKDEMPGIILRSTIRATAKTLAQKEIQSRNAYAGLLMTAVSLVTESADERMWRTLPSTVKIWRQPLEYGQHSISIGNQRFLIDIDSPHTVIPVRVIGGNAFLVSERDPEAAMQIVAEGAESAL